MRKYNSNQSFTSMDEEGQREISNRGGRFIHQGRERDYDNYESRDYRGFRPENETVREGRSRSFNQGYSPIDESEQREIFSRGENALHTGRERSYYDTDPRDFRSSEQDIDFDRSYRGQENLNRGFVPVNAQERREIANRGERGIHSGTRGDIYDYESRDFRGSRRDEDYDTRAQENFNRGYTSMDEAEPREFTRSGSRPLTSSQGRDFYDYDSRGIRRTSPDAYDRADRGQRITNRGYSSLSDQEVMENPNRSGRFTSPQGSAREFNYQDSRDARYNEKKGRW